MECPPSAGDATRASAVSLDGEIVEIIKSGGVYSLRVVLHHSSVFDLDPRLVTDFHLGDRVSIDGVLRVDNVRLSVEPGTRRTT